jgi:hypothetical protein
VLVATSDGLQLYEQSHARYKPKGALDKLRARVLQCSVVPAHVAPTGTPAATLLLDSDVLAVVSLPKPAVIGTWTVPLEDSVRALRNVHLCGAQLLRTRLANTLCLETVSWPAPPVVAAGGAATATDPAGPAAVVSGHGDALQTPPPPPAQPMCV